MSKNFQDTSDRKETEFPYSDHLARIRQKQIEEINKYFDHGKSDVSIEARALHEAGEITELEELIMKTAASGSKWGQERLAYILLKEADIFFMDLDMMIDRTVGPMAEYYPPFLDVVASFKKEAYAKCENKSADHILATIGSKDITCANIATYFPDENENYSMNHDVSFLIGTHEDLGHQIQA